MNKIETKQQAFDLYKKTRLEFLEFARWTARKVLKDSGTVTTDDLRKLITLPPGIDPRCWGAVLSGDEFEKIGYTTTKIRTSHGRPIGIWRLKGGAR